MPDPANPAPKSKPIAWLVAVGVVALAATTYVVRERSGTRPYGMEQRGEARPWLGLPAEPIFPQAGNWTKEVAFPNVTFRNPVFLEPEPGSRRLFVGELEGRLYAIDGADFNTSEKRLLLDLSARTQGGWDSGMLGLVFHPEYDLAGSPSRGFVYIFYSWTDDPVVIGRPDQHKETWTRLARFKVDPATGVADPGSELVLFSQRDVNIYHAGGGMFFHPRDGFLHVSVGDEGGARDFRGNSQRIDHNLFAGVLRIDVDQRGGSISHPIRKHPVDGQSGNYFIPNDNPFVGVPNALEEFYAVGLRSPHRMTYDPVDNLAWIGDIGQSAVEEVSVLEFDRGPLNFQWNVREGTKAGFAEPGEKPALGIWTDPIWEFGRDQGRSIIGGYVYRGPRYPALQGKYIVGDFGSGRIWALSYARGAPPRLTGTELLAQLASTSYNYRGGEGGLTSFGRSHEGELYLLFHGMYTRIARLAEAKAQPGNIPTLLSETGVFSDVRNLVPAPGLVPYDVNLAGWTDNVPARRWISVPTGEKVRFDRADRWTFPPGTVLVQHFEVMQPEPSGRGGAQPGKSAENAAPASTNAKTDSAAGELQLRRLETRLLVAAADGSFYSLGYRWKPDNSDAEMVTTDAAQNFRVIENGRPRQESWTHTRSEGCAECHSAEAGYVLGVKARQLNRELAYPGGVTDQQLRTWGHLGLLEGAPDERAIATMDRLARLEDESQSPEHRVRSYLDVNCAHCHGAKPIRAAWNGNLAVPLRDQGILFGPLLGDNTSGGFHVVAPKDLTGSVLHRRAASDDVIERMPPAGAQRKNDAFSAVLRRWIEEMPRTEAVAPELFRVRRRGEAVVEVVFTEAVRAGAEAAGAERAENYRVSDGVQVMSATLKEDLRTVTLATTPLQAGQAYTLSVSGVSDRAEKPNVIANGAQMAVPRQ